MPPTITAGGLGGPHPTGDPRTGSPGGPSTDGLGAPSRGRRRAALLSVTGVAVAVVVIGAAVRSWERPAHAASSQSQAPPTAKVVRTDLASTQQISGSIGYEGSYTVINPAGTASQALMQAQQQVATAKAQLAAANTSLSDTNTGNAQSISQQQTAVDTAKSTLASDQAKQATDCSGTNAASQACAADNQTVKTDQAQVTSAESQLSGAEVNATKALHGAEAQVVSANIALQNAQQALVADQRTAANPGTTYTSLPALGQVISQGQVLYAIDGRPVPLLYGPVAAYRVFAAGMPDGPDVGQLTSGLIAVGQGGGLKPGSNHFSAATTVAVKRWQASLGLETTGIIKLGEVAFEPGPLRVSALHAAAGGAANVGAVLDATSTNRVVTVALAVDKEYLVRAGDAVTVQLPDGKSTITGHVRDISTVATSSSNGSNNNGSTTTVNVTITFDQPSASGNFDKAPVTVNITDQSVHGVLAVPINALLALAEGGDAVEVVSGGTRNLVPVHTGLFSDNLVEITGQGIGEGTLVEVPSS